MDVRLPQINLAQDNYANSFTEDTMLIASLLCEPMSIDKRLSMYFKYIHD